MYIDVIQPGWVHGDRRHARHWYEDYERGRPGYPDQVVDLAELDWSATALELGAGTGRFTSQLISRIPHVVAVELDPGMPCQLGAGCPGIEAVDGTAEQIPLSDDAVDAVFVAQAFHWFDNETTLAEIARLLRPGRGPCADVECGERTGRPLHHNCRRTSRTHLASILRVPLDMMRGDWAPSGWNLPLADLKPDPRAAGVHGSVSGSKRRPRMASWCSCMSVMW
ncbi:class I SAM-dependent methyltransferase [Leekyejoonella antrihumi]|uniref:class I SAM-dependent methyltransferase n=1 Tax=Leekyejoonella antrihumi TaxID=1660198 RepID=UPI003CCC5A26